MSRSISEYIEEKIKNRSGITLSTDGASKSKKQVMEKSSTSKIYSTGKNKVTFPTIPIYVIWFLNFIKRDFASLNSSSFHGQDLDILTYNEQETRVELP